MSPPKSAGIQTANLGSSGGEPSLLAFEMRGAPEAKPTFNTDDKQPAKTARSTATNAPVEGRTSFNLFCSNRSLLIDAPAQRIRLRINSVKPKISHCKCLRSICTPPTKIGQKLPRITTIPETRALEMAIPNRARLTPKSTEPAPNSSPHPPT